MNGLNPAADYRRLRLQAAINHLEADRIPLTLGSPSCSLHRIAHDNLLKCQGLVRSTLPLITDNILQIVETDPRLMDFFDIDMYWLLPREAPVRWYADTRGYTDEFGRSFWGEGGFFNQTTHPLTRHDVGELEAFSFPDLVHTDRFDHLPLQARILFDQGLGLGIDGPWGIYEISSSLVGTEQYLIDLALNQRYARQVAEKVLEKYHLPFYERLLSRTGLFVQVIGISDDLGSQDNLIFSPKTFRKIFKPLLGELVDHIHRLSDAKVYMHSDGAIYAIIPDLIDIGVEGINPVQYTAKGMELEKLKQEFGKDLGFFGGVVDNTVLSFGTPDGIREIARKNVSILKQDGGFIFAPIHNISQEVPPENIIALYQAGAEFGVY
jgi:uroporphyrinogen decarboxylase